MSTNQQFSFDFNIPVHRVYSFFKWLIVINILFLIGTWLHAEKVIFPGNATAQWFLVELDFAKENVVASWYSSMLMFCIALSAALCYWVGRVHTENKRGIILNYGWLGMCGIFMMLSYDEMGSFHEMIGHSDLFVKVGGSKGRWVFMVVIGVVALFMAVFFWTTFKKNRKALLLTIFGLFLLISNPVQERFELYSWYVSPDPNNWHRPVFFLLLEEGSEIFASCCFLFSFVTYAMAACEKAGGDRGLKISIAAGKNFIVWPAALALLLGIIMWLVHKNAWNIEGDDNGVPQDWPPAMISFTAFVTAIYLYFKKGLESNRFIYLSVAIVSLITSAYFGSYMYGYFEGPFAKMPYILLGFIVIAGLLSVVKLKDVFTKVFIAGWVAVMAHAVSKKEFASALYGYIACSFLLLALLWHCQIMYKQNKAA